MSNDHTIHTFSLPPNNHFVHSLVWSAFQTFTRISKVTLHNVSQSTWAVQRGSVSEVLCESHWSGVNSGRAGLEQTVADWLWSAGDLSCALKVGGGVSLPTDRRSKAGWNWYDGFPLSRRAAFSLLFCFFSFMCSTFGTYPPFISHHSWTLF